MSPVTQMALRRKVMSLKRNKMIDAYVGRRLKQTVPRWRGWTGTGNLMPPRQRSAYVQWVNNFRHDVVGLTHCRIASDVVSRERMFE